MADVIKCNTQKLDSDKNSVSKNLSDINKGIANLTRIINRIDSMWDGTASEAYKARIRNDISSLSSICKNISGIVTYEDNSVTEYNKSEKKISGIISSIQI